MSKSEFPKWLKRVRGNAVAFEIDPAIAYPAILQELGAEHPDQYWLEVAYQYMKLAAQAAIVATGCDPRPEQSLILLFGGDGSAKRKWAQIGHDPGHMTELRTQYGDGCYRKCGRDARTMYANKHGALPQ